MANGDALLGRNLAVADSLRARKAASTSDGESINEPEEQFELPERIFVGNAEGLVDNPLLRLRPNEIGPLGRTFARVYKLGYLQDLFEKAAKLAKDPLGWDSEPTLTQEERHALQSSYDESRVGLLGFKSNGFWGQPKQLRITIITLCVAAVVQGWNQTAGNGANLNWPRQLGLTNVDGCNPTGPRDAWIFAIVNASTYLSASLIGCWLTDPLSESFAGRRAPICLSAILILASAIGGAATHSWRQLLACRILLGIGMGCKASMVPVFAAEVAPAHIRGSLVMNWQLFDAFGIFLGFTANLILSTTGRPAWRYQTASSALPTIVLLTLVFVCPESPRFLMKRGHYQAAYQTLVLLRGHPILAAKELFYVHCQMEVEARSYGKRDVESNGHATPSAANGRKHAHQTPKRARSNWITSYGHKLAQLFTVPRIRRAMGAAIVCMICQQICGVNVLAFYSSTIFYAANNEPCLSNRTHSDLTALWLSWGIGLSNFIFAFPAYKFIDSRGRRWLLLVTLPFLALSMLAAGLSFLIPSSNAAHAPVIGIFIYIFMFFYSWGLGPVPFTMSAEVFPLENRVVGMSFAVFVNLFGAGLLTLFVPALTNAIGHPGLLGIFAGLNVIAFFLVFFFVRETAGAAIGGGASDSMTSVSLEELNYIFEVSTKRHRQYQLNEMVPWTFRNFGKLLLFRYVDPPPKCYNWAEAKQEQEMQSVQTPIAGAREI